MDPLTLTNASRIEYTNQGSKLSPQINQQGNASNFIKPLYEGRIVQIGLLRCLGKLVPIGATWTNVDMMNISWIEDKISGSLLSQQINEPNNVEILVFCTRNLYNVSILILLVCRIPNLDMDRLTLSNA